MPRLAFGDGSVYVAAAVPVAIALSVFVAHWGKARLDQTGRKPPVGWISAALIVGLPIIAFFIAGRPIAFDMPVFNETGPILRRGFQSGTRHDDHPRIRRAGAGTMSILTAAYIAEVVRAGIEAVSHGQTEEVLKR